MKKQIVHVEPLFKERIWGGTQIKSRFYGVTAIDRVGEMWCIAALKGNGDNRLSEINMTLSETYEKIPEWFNCQSEYFPIRCTLMDPIDNLSVQVHPTEEYANRELNSYGKPEAWYIIESKENHSIQFGHKAQTKKEFLELVTNKRWQELLNYVDVKTGDFLDVPAGTIHAIGKNILSFEISRNADITYRIYDYDRLDIKTGLPRDLHLASAMKVLTIPHTEKGPIHPEPVNVNGCMISKLIDEAGKFTLTKIETTDDGEYDNPYFYFITIIHGNGSVNGISVRPGTTLLIPANFGKIKFKDQFTALLSSYHD
ncbi:MAG: hypothetical protein VB012_03175 [Erysipelotrichaceae bacterium]|nr:hypothetical protein [Erysipelotrichaceae bacterium]